MQLNGSGNIQPGQQLSSTTQLQQKHESAIDDRLIATATSAIDVKPILSSVGQTSIPPISDASTNQKVTQSLFNLFVVHLHWTLILFVSLIVTSINNEIFHSTSL